MEKFLDAILVEMKKSNTHLELLNERVKMMEFAVERLQTNKPTAMPAPQPTVDMGEVVSLLKSINHCLKHVDDDGLFKRGMAYDLSELLSRLDDITGNGYNCISLGDLGRTMDSISERLNEITGYTPGTSLETLKDSIGDISGWGNISLSDLNSSLDRLDDKLQDIIINTDNLG